MTKDEATTRFKALVARYGLQWTARTVPKPAWQEMDEVNRLLNEADKRKALDLPV